MAPHASYSLNEGARLARLGDRMAAPKLRMPVWERCLLLRGPSAFSYLGQPAILSIRSRSFRHALPVGVVP